MRIIYTGGPLGLHMLVRDLRAESVEVSYEPPEERRGAGDVAVTVALWVAEQAGKGAVAAPGGMTFKAMVRRIVAAYRERNPGARVDISEDAA